MGVVGLPPGDGGDQPFLEVVPDEDAVLVERDRDAEDPALPRLGEDELAVGPGWGRRSVDVELDRKVLRQAHATGVGTRATPTIASRVTSAASSSSERSSVPSGRSGRTK